VMSIHETPTPTCTAIFAQMIGQPVHIQKIVDAQRKDPDFEKFEYCADCVEDDEWK
jgi:hypothetical protein